MKDKLYKNYFDEDIAKLIRQLRNPAKLVLLRKIGDRKFSDILDEVEAISSRAQLNYFLESLEDSYLVHRPEKGSESSYVTELGVGIYRAVEEFEKDSDLNLDDIYPVLNTEGGVNVFHYLPDGDLSEVRRSKFRKSENTQRFPRQRVEERVQRYLDIGIIEEDEDGYREGPLYESVNNLVNSLEESIAGYHLSKGIEFVENGQIEPNRPENLEEIETEEDESQNNQSLKKLEKFRASPSNETVLNNEPHGTDPEGQIDKFYDILRNNMDPNLDLDSLNDRLEDDIYLSETVLTESGEIWAKDVEGLPYILRDQPEELDEYVLVRKTGRFELGQPYGEVLDSFSENELNQ